MATASDEMPREIELCSRCKAGLVFRLGGASIENARMPYCPKCGARVPGQRYVRADLVES